MGSINYCFLAIVLNNSFVAVPQLEKGAVIFTEVQGQVRVRAGQSADGKVERSPSDSTQDQEDDDDHEDKSHSARRVITPAATM
jgi:hypothetical protein